MSDGENPHKGRPMLTAEARVHSERPSRYIHQLCRHAQQIQRLRDRGRLLHARGFAQPPPEVKHVEWSEASGTVSFGWGHCVMEAGPTTLTLHAEATDEANLQWIQGIIARDIERFGKREHVKVDWHRREAPGVGGTDSPDDPRAHEAAPAAGVRRADHRTMALASAGTVGVVLVVLVHLGLGGAVLAALGLGVPAIGLVVALAAKAVLVAAIALRRRAARRSKASAAGER